MTPETYKEYATVFDLFSTEKLFPQMQEFMGKVAEFLPTDADVTDVGGGTGYYTKKLLEARADLQLTFLEPSEDMMNYAKNRLPSGVQFIQSTFDEAIKELPEQDAFIFLRSLYSFYGDIGSYKELARNLYKNLSHDGVVCISEMTQTYDLELMQNYYLKNISVLELSEEQFWPKWKVFEAVLTEFNENTSNGKFTLFTPSSLESVFVTAGFELKWQQGMMMAFAKA